MSRRFVCLLAVVTVGAFASVLDAGPVLLGSTSNGTFYEIDPSTGQASSPRATGIGGGDSGVFGLAFTPSGSLLARVSDFGRSGDQLFSVDPVTFATEAIGPSTGTATSDFEYNVRTGTLLGVLSSGGALVTIDTETGTVGTRASELTDAGSLASDATGRAYAVNSATGSIIEVDPITGAVLSEWLIGFNLSIESTTFMEDKLLILGISPNDISTLFEFDPGSGLFGTIGPVTTAGRISALAYVPEPAMWALLVVGAVVIRVRQKRERRQGLVRENQD